MPQHENRNHRKRPLSYHLDHAAPSVRWTADWRSVSRANPRARKHTLIWQLSNNRGRVRSLRHARVGVAGRSQSEARRRSDRTTPIAPREHTKLDKKKEVLSRAEERRTEISFTLGCAAVDRGHNDSNSRLIFPLTGSQVFALEFLMWNFHSRTSLEPWPTWKVNYVIEINFLSRLSSREPRGARKLLFFRDEL